MSSAILSLKVIAQTSKVHTGTVIFLHGSGQSGHGVYAWIKSLLRRDMEFPEVKMIFPTAPLRSYTLLHGEKSHVWFDRLSISPDVPEQLETINSMAKELSSLVDKEVQQGIPLNRIIIGGFSMGGALAIHMGYRVLPQLGGVFALSSFLNDKSTVYEALQKKPEANLPPFFMCHGDDDDLVPLNWGSNTFSLLHKFGVPGEFHPLNGALHELTKNEMLGLCDWINQRLPSTVSPECWNLK